jgi:hypothetical protein
LSGHVASTSCMEGRLLDCYHPVCCYSIRDGVSLISLYSNSFIGVQQSLDCFLWDCFPFIHVSTDVYSRSNENAILSGILAQTYMAGQPVYGGVNDPRLGDIHDKSDPGYFGHIELARPVYHYGFLDIILKALRCVCFHCSRITLEEEDFRFRKAKGIKNRKRRLTAMHELIRPKKKCDHCNGVQPKYTRVGLHVEIEYADEMDRVPGSSGDKKQFLSAQKAVDIL